VGSLLLPAGVLVYMGHEWSEDPTVVPVAVAAPRVAPTGVLMLDGVFASDAADAWWDVAAGLARGVSIVAHIVDYLLDPFDWQLRASEAVLYGADIVRHPADSMAWIRDIRPDLTPVEAEVQRRFDTYLADPAMPRGIDIEVALIDTPTVEPLEPLRSVVAGLHHSDENEGSPDAARSPHRGGGPPSGHPGAGGPDATMTPSLTPAGGHIRSRGSHVRTP
jgi:hypothetical protein